MGEMADAREVAKNCKAINKINNRNSSNNNNHNILVYLTKNKF